MKKILVIVFLLIAKTGSSTWNVVNSNLTQDLKAIETISNDNNKLIVIAEDGIYYNMTANVNTIWTKYNVVGNQADSIIFAHTVFSAMTYYSSNVVFFCGTDTFQHKAVICGINFANLTFSIPYIGGPNSALNCMKKTFNDMAYIAVGDNGLMLYTTNFSSFTTVNTNLSNDLYTISDMSTGVDLTPVVGGDGIIIKWPNLNFNPQYFLKPGLNARKIYAYNYNKLHVFTDSISIYDANVNFVRKSANFDYGNLHPQYVDNQTNGYYVCTDHGIYSGLSGNTWDIMDFQVSSAGYSLNGMKINTLTAFAVGDNGVILKTTNIGMPQKPYTMILTEGACIGVNFNLYGTYLLAGGTCQWKINNNPLLNGCGPNVVFNNAGDDTLTYYFSYPTGMSDTVVKIIHISPLPDTTLSVTMLDTSYLCKSGTKQIEIQNTQAGTFYGFYKVPNLNSNLGIVTGTGNTDTLNTSLLDNAGYYVLKATDSMGVCSLYFPDTLKINIDETKAEFASSKINGLQGEGINFHSRSRDADSAQWFFSNNATPAIGSNIDQLGVVFADTGLTFTTLIATSIHGCKDTLSKYSTSICQEPNYTDSCWANSISGPDTIAGGTYLYTNFVTNDNQMLVGGAFYRDVYDSKNGISGTNQPWLKGGYLAKYSLNGTLKWTTKIAAITHYPLNIAVQQINTDDSGNIYILVPIYFPNQTADVYYYENTGDSILIKNSFQGIESALIKTDSLGNYLWHVSLTNGWFADFDISKGNNRDIAIVGHHLTDLIYNGIDTTFTVGLYTPLPQTTNMFILYLDINGGYKWATNMTNNTVNVQNHINTVRFDQHKNLYILGEYEIKLIFNSTNGNSDTLLRDNFGYGARMFEAKYDSAGVFKWKFHGKLQLADKLYASSIDVDSVGYTYMTTGYELLNINPNTDHLYFFNANGSTYVSALTSKYTLQKISPDGNLIWVASAFSPQQSVTPYLNKVRIKDNHLYMAVNTYNTNASLFSVRFYSRDFLDSLQVTGNKLNFTIAKYDLAGHLESVSFDTINTSYQATLSLRDMYPSIDNSSMYICGNLSGYLPNVNYLYGDTLPSNGHDAYAGRATLSGCNQIMINLNHTYFDTAYVCYGTSYLFPDSTYVPLVNQQMTHVSHILAMNGSDSNIHTRLLVHPIQNYSYLVPICKGDNYIFPDSTSYTSIQTDTSYLSHFTNIFGCDSNILIMLEIPQIDTLILASNDSLFSNNGNATYQWLDCSTNTIIPGQTLSYYIPSAIGSYAVIITKGGCTDTSDCYLVTQNTELINESDFVQITPNPTNGTFLLQLGKLSDDVTIEIYDVSGRIVYSQHYDKLFSKTLTISEAPGIYYLKIKVNDVTRVIKISKQ